MFMNEPSGPHLSTVHSFSRFFNEHRWRTLAEVMKNWNSGKKQLAIEPHWTTPQWDAAPMKSEEEPGGVCSESKYEWKIAT